MFDLSNFIIMNHLSKINLNDGLLTYEMLIILIFYIISIFQDNIKNTIIKIIKFYSKNTKKYASINIIGWDTLSGSSYTFEYPYNMIAINYYIFINNKINNFKYYCSGKNGIYYRDDYKDYNKFDNKPIYILDDIYNLQIYDDIYISNNTETIETHNDTKKNAYNWKKNIIIKSYNHDIKYIENFIEKCIIIYENYIFEKNKNKTYHFIYNQKKEDSSYLKFNSNIISNYNNNELVNYETFDNLFHSHKDRIIKDINKLKDIEFYKRNGLKRKKGYLFYGSPGTGKTSTVMAMSNYDKRHIIEIPLSRVKTNSDFEKILSLNNIDDINFNHENIILLFDELDIDTKLDIKENTKNKKNDTVELVLEKDRLSLNTILSRLDGIGNYSGLIIVATTNNIDNINKALYRDGRLTLLEFTNATSKDLKDMIEKYYEIQINDDLSKFHLKIPHSKIRCYLEQYDNKDNFIKNLTTLI